jgi:hypothetical protein
MSPSISPTGYPSESSFASTCFAYAEMGRGLGFTVGLAVGVTDGVGVGGFGVPGVVGVLGLLGVLGVLGVSLGVVLAGADGLGDVAVALGVPDDAESAATSVHPVSMTASRTTPATRPRRRDTIPLSVGFPRVAEAQRHQPKTRRTPPSAEASTSTRSVPALLESCHRTVAVTVGALSSSCR